MFLDEISLKVCTFELVSPSLQSDISHILTPQSKLRQGEYSSHIILYIYVKKKIISVIGLTTNNTGMICRGFHIMELDSS